MEGENEPTARGSRLTMVVVGILSIACFSLALSLATSQQRRLGCPSCNCAGSYDPDIGLLTTSAEAEDTENKLGFGLAIFILTLSVCIIASLLISKHSVSTVPDCLGYVFIGIIIGTSLRLAKVSATAGYALPNQEQFFLFIIPPIIFEAGYSLNKGDFFKQAGSIITFAVLGTIITALVFGLALYGAGVVRLTYSFRLWEALTFGALVSAVDPVATLAIFNALKVNRQLHYLVFGESVVNDAVAIVLYHTFAQMIGQNRPLWYVPIVNFVYIFAGSVAIGALTSFVTAIVLKHLDLHKHPTLELGFYLLMAYLPYFLCEGFGMSGIMGILTGGILLAHYAHGNLSQITQVSSNQCFKSVGYLAETFVFVYLGTALSTFNHSWDGSTVLFAIVLTLLSRAANIFPLSLLVNRYRGDAKIAAKSQFIMWFSGLRGAIAFALSLNFPGGNELTRRVVISTTLAIVLFTVIVLGGGTLPILQLLRVEGANSAHYNPKPVLHVEGRDAEVIEANRNGRAEHGYSEYQKGWLERMDESYVKPFLSTARSMRTERSSTTVFQRLADLTGEGEALTPAALNEFLELSDDD
eukprot:Plantae.Rhodophyta-Purpureofilum_apyrenoidigerum.ctg28036.p1 GENE.Plantae.Rhodophyta-Purpureofilum_apyrenoidigerum.ctg28036~~Plantae.Rhodophyta-Purpureofilum_apyrenoidigerum.ctg28036.p1  ORF type:complete len:583 (-),score=97.74 Plantae.Rhodophyta-Purpureofilum_apyrenoidigerum.ctg28036:63-1811(-)